MTQPHQVNMGWLQNEAARIAQQQAQREAAMGTKDFYNLETDYVTYFRIAPPWSAAGAFGRSIGRHYQIPGSRAGKKGDICLANWPALSMQCPLCAVYEKLYEDSPKKSPPKEEAYQSKRREYFYVNAFIIGRSPRVNQGTEDVPQWVDGAFEPMQEDPLRCRILKLSPKTFNYFVQQYWTTKINITSASDGVMCMVQVTGTGKATRYTENMAGSNGVHGFQPQQSKLFETEEHIANALSSINDLDGIWKQPDDAAVQEINQIAFGVSSRWGQQIGVPTVAGAATLPGAILQPPAAHAALALPAPGVAPSPALPLAPGTLALPAPPVQPPAGVAPATPVGIVPPAPPAVPAGAPAQVTAPPPPPGAAAPPGTPPVAPPATVAAPGAPPAFAVPGALPPAPGAPPPPAVPGAPPPTAPAPAAAPPATAAPMAPPPAAPPPPPAAGTLPPGPPTAPAPGTAPAAAAPGPAPAAAAPGPAPAPAAVAAAPAAPIGTEKPEGSPECFGQHHVKSNHADPTVRVICQGCHWATVCEVSPANMALKAAG